MVIKNPSESFVKVKPEEYDHFDRTSMDNRGNYFDYLYGSNFAMEPSKFVSRPHDDFFFAVKEALVDQKASSIGSLFLNLLDLPDTVYMHKLGDDYASSIRKTVTIERLDAYRVTCELTFPKDQDRDNLYGDLVNIIHQYGSDLDDLHDFLYILKHFGKTSRPDNRCITLVVKAAPSTQYRQQRHPEILEITLTCGDFKFTQINSRRTMLKLGRGHLSPHSFLEKILVTKNSSSDKEGILLYLNNSCALRPYWDIWRDQDLSGLLLGDFWTESEKGLAVMSGFNEDEIFLDSQFKLPIIGLLPRFNIEDIEKKIGSVFGNWCP